MISQKAKYAFQALLALADAPDGEQLVISEIAERHNIPKKFLEQILLDLKHRAIVVSRRGKAGGYALLKSPEEITPWPMTRRRRSWTHAPWPIPCATPAPGGRPGVAAAGTHGSPRAFPAKVDATFAVRKCDKPRA